MNALLMKYKPKDISPEKWKEMWNNAGYLLRPLAEVMREHVESYGSVKANDFDSPNHYARMVWESGKKEEAQFVLDLLPNSAKS